MVLGIIAIVLAVLYLLVNVFSVVAMLSSFSESSPGSPVGEGHILFGPLTTIASTVLATMLLVAGIGLMRQRAWTRTLFLTWAVFDLIETLGGFVVAAVQVRQQLSAASSGGAAMPPGILEGMLIGGVACGLLPGLAIPIFFIVWFLRGKIKREVASWQSAQRSERL
jgi:hypothetical protein